MSSDDFRGWSETLPCVNIQEIADKMKPQLEEKVYKTYPHFVAIYYRYLGLCGATHYLIKVSVSNTEDECVHLLVVQGVTAVPVEPALMKYQLNKTGHDPLELF
ncbi:cystatin-A5-like [Macrochelys suwanniensis]